MSYSSILLVKPLYDVQKQIDLLYKKYKNEIYEYDDKTTTVNGKAPKNAVIQYYTNMVNSLNKYNIIKASIINEKAIIDKQIKGIRTLLIIILVISTILIYYTVISKFTAIFKGNRPLSIYLLIVSTISLSVSYMVVVRISRTFLFKYEKIYNSTPFEESYIIKHMISMMDIDTTSARRKKKQRFVKLRHGMSSNPMMMWWLSNLKSYEFTFDYSPLEVNTPDLSAEEVQNICEEEKSDNTKDDKEKQVKKEFENCVNLSTPKCLDGYYKNIKINKTLSRKNILDRFMPCDHNMKVQPFDMIEKDELYSPLYLLKQIESYDKYNQLNRLNKAVLYFKGLMLLKNDAEYKPLDQKGIDDLEKELITQLKITHAIVKNLDLPEGHLHTPEYISLSEAMSNLLENKDGMGFVYKDGICYSFKKGDDVTFVYLKEPNPDVTAFIKNDAGMEVNIYTKFEPDADVLNDIFNMNLEKMETLKMYSYCISDAEKKCTSDFAYSSLANIDYETLFASGTVEQDNMYTYRTEFASIYKINVSKNIKKTAELAKNYLIDKLVGLITKADPITSYRLKDDFLITNIKSHYGVDWLLITNIILDLINETNEKLIFIQKQREADGYVSVEKFVAKVSAITQDDFLNKYFVNIDEIRFTSKNLYNLKDKYDYTEQNTSTRYNVFMSIFGLIMVIGSAECIRLFYKLYKKSQEDYRNSHPGYYYPREDGADIEYKWVENVAITKSDPLHKPKKINLLSTLFVQCAIVFLVFSFSTALLYAYIVKNKKVFDFNLLISTSNGDIIKSDSNALFNEYLDALKNGTLFPSSYEFKDSDIEDLKIEYIKETSNASIETLVILDNVDLIGHYEKLKNILSSYEKCNYLTDGKIEAIPFPVLDFVMYSILLLTTLIVLLYLYFTIQPFEKLHMIKILINLKKILKKGKSVSPDDLRICEENNIKIETIINGMLFILIIISTLFVLILLYTNTNKLSSTLYTSDLFRDNNCYFVS